MAYFEFINRETGERDILIEVHNEIARYTGNVDKLANSDFCDPNYDALISAGFAMLMRVGGWEVTEKHVEKFIEKCPQLKEDRGAEFLRWAFVQKWRFKAWRK